MNWSWYNTGVNSLAETAAKDIAKQKAAKALLEKSKKLIIKAVTK